MLEDRIRFFGLGGILNLVLGIEDGKKKKETN